MLYRTHFVTGLGAGYLLSGSLEMAAISGVAALLPDIDHPGSYIGQRIPVLPTIIKWTVGHRGPFHSLAAALVAGVIALIIGGKAVGLVVMIGYLAHLLGDLFTLSGVPLLFPLKFDARVPIVKTGGILEKFVVFPMLCLVLIFLVAHPVLEKLEKL
ncbi:MAG: metal-dependent hydrolase [Peptococcaceae bacterium]|nr:metal-dependent hydrolase [Peptococcaceae bacterium]